MLSTEEEIRLIKQYQNGDMEAGNTVITARMKWIYYIIKGFSFPQHIDFDELACDLAADISIALRNYDPELASVSTYLYDIIRKQAPHFAKNQAQQFSVAIDGNQIIEEEILDPSEVLETIRFLFDSVDLNEQSRLVFDRMLKGSSASEIGRQLGWKNPRVKERMEAVRCLIAHTLLNSGHSASPWIQDKELKSLADKHQTEETWLAQS